MADRSNTERQDSTNATNDCESFLDTAENLRARRLTSEGPFPSTEEMQREDRAR